MGHFRNFKTVVYIPAWTAMGLTKEKLDYDFAYLEKYIGLDKVYLETHRDEKDVDREQILMIRDFLEQKGVEVSGGITTTIDDFEGTEAGKQRLFNTFCYTDPAMRQRLREISEYAAGLFDEVILDDFYFTNCSCERCIREKGDQDWVSFRKKLMTDVSENLIVGPARAVNPKVKMIIKYPNWRESYHFTGYLPGEQGRIFDGTYTGTETRSPAYTDQHLPEYLSYSLMRYMDNAWPGRNGGGWFDTYQCWSIDRYLEQAYLTAFSGAKELMHFQWSDLIDNPFTAPMGLMLSRIDRLLEGIGSPTGVPVCIPHESCGENHLEMRFGMVGAAMDPTPHFDPDAKKIFLTESACADSGIVSKLEAFVRKGGDAVITSGFLRRAGDELRKAGLTQAWLTGSSIAVTRYQVTGDYSGYEEHEKAVLFPEICHGNNNEWSLLNGGDGDFHASLLLRCSYGKGRLYVMAVPENQAGLYDIPPAALDVYKRILSDGIYATGRGFSMFTYDDGSLILYRYVKGNLRPERVTIHTGTEVSALRDVSSGRRFEPVEEVAWEDFERRKAHAYTLLLEPGRFVRLKCEKE
ncbi:MAG: hypothetical protein K6E50_07315 [Lachnospiraceae bacterium]|nr:hypothetical protein [Lachnospiraceae bacterium]